MKICVYGAASDKIDDIYKNAGETLGKEIARRGHSLVFGGGSMGMMGACARGVKSENGTSLGISPTFFQVDGLLFDSCTKYLYTETMRERKQLLESESDGFIITPGGIGTLDEFMEIFTLRQLKRHSKPIAVFNVDGFYDPFVDFLQSLAIKNFVAKDTLSLCLFSSDIDEILNYLENPPELDFEVEKLKNLK